MQNGIKNFKQVPFDKSNFLKPVTVEFEENGVKKIWDLVESHDSVAIFIVNYTNETIIFVKQFRAPVYHKNKTDGYTYELCAGIMDEDETPKECAIKECLEECGYAVPPEHMVELADVYSQVGITGAKQTWFMAEVHQGHKVSEGGGINDENIEVIEMPLKDIGAFVQDKTKQKTAGLIAFLMTLSQGQ